MKILAIETSCDETAVAILECTGDLDSASFRVLGNALLSQIDMHREYGGVFPALAKREHAKNLVPLLSSALEEAELLHEDTQAIPDALHEELVVLLEREPVLAESLFAFIAETERPDIDAIAVTHGPGLAPALWVGVNFARALSMLWNIPIVPVNHLEGHILSSLLDEENDGTLSFSKPALPLLSLVISGGHTELVVSDALLSYRLIGATKDDAVGEAYDKAARMLNLPYPGGPEMSKRADHARTLELRANFTLPRPMMDAPNCDFSFSGLKTAVLYKLKERGELDEDETMKVAREFDDAVTEVLSKKTLRALEETGARALALGGGVSAASNIRKAFEELATQYPDLSLYLPLRSLTGDNAIMIGVAGYFHALAQEFVEPAHLTANGNLSLS